MTLEVNMINIGELLLGVSRFSSYWKLLYVTVWIFRFVTALKTKAKFPKADLQMPRTFWIRRVKKERFSTELTALEREEQLTGSSKITRYNPSLNDVIIRLGGRLQCTQVSYVQRHPEILDHHLTKLLIKPTHIRLHHLAVWIVLGDLKEEFWILRARRVLSKSPTRAYNVR